ncbi:MAG: peptidylprolyl isomerase [Clostridia bacterium]|nr:peptidylprolyl isomerase [Clostridia bacterium]
MSNYKSKKKIIIATVAILLVIAGVVTAVVMLGNKDVVATVNGEKITKEDYAMYLFNFEYSVISQVGISSQEEANAFWTTTEIEGKSAGDIAKERAMEQAVNTTIICQKAKEMGISLTEEEKAQINQQIEMSITNMGGREKFEEHLKDIGTDMDAYKKYIEYEALAGKFVETMAAMPEYTVTEDQAREHIRTTYIKAKHILISTMDEFQQPYSEEEKAAAKAQADEIYQQIMNGADFDALMNQYSQDPGLLTSPDGYIFGKGRMIAEFEDAAYTLQVGQVSAPVETSYGYHIIKREEVVITDELIEENLAWEMQYLPIRKQEEAFEQWKAASNIQIDQNKIATITLSTLKVK